MLRKVENHLVVDRVVGCYTILAAALWRIHVVDQGRRDLHVVFISYGELLKKGRSRLVEECVLVNRKRILRARLEPIRAFVELNSAFYAVSV